MGMDIVYVVIGIALVVYGANIMTEGASGIAGRLGVSEFVIGMTVVAIGTSAPELVVSVMSALRGEDAIAVGNVVGSNLFNTLVIVGVTAIITPMTLTADNVRKDIPFGVLATIVLIICAGDYYLDQGALPVINRSEGLLMLCFFAIFLAYSLYSGMGVKKALRAESQSPGQADGTGPRQRKVWLLALMTLGGLAGLVVGGNLFLDGAVSLAHRFGISDTVIAVTVVAGGTSLPELAASVVAAVKGKPGIALGNILGSNVLNIFLVLGASASINPLGMGDIGMPDLAVVFGAAFLMFVTAFTFRKKRIDRIEGILFLLLYVAYIVWVIKR